LNDHYRTKQNKKPHIKVGFFVDFLLS